MTEAWMPAAQWLAHTAVGGGLLLLLVYGLMALVRQPARRQRLGEWGTGAALLCAVLALGPSWLTVSVPLPLENEAAPRLEPLPVVALAEGPPSEAPSESGAADSPAPVGIYYYPVESPVELPAQPPAPALPAAAPRPVSASFDAAGIASTLVVLFGMGAALLIGRWLIGTLFLWQLVRTSRPAPERAARLFAAMAAGHQPAPRLLVARQLRVPVSCGLFRPTVLIPALWCRRLEELRWVFAHELTHLQRRDAWSCLLFGLAQAVFFYMPWFWGLRRQVRLCQEYVADAAAAEQPQPVEDYAQFLLGLTMAPAVPIGATGVLGTTSDLYRRVTMLLKSPISVEKRCPGLWSLGVAGGLLTAAIFASGVGLRAEPSEPARATPRAADDALPPPRPPTPPEIPDRGERPAVERLRILVQEAERRAPANAEDVQKELKKAVEEAQKALQQLQNLQPGGNPEQIHKEVQKAMEELRKAMAQQQQDVRRALEMKDRALRHLEYMNVGQLGSVRLGVQLEPPSPALVDQLGLNKGEGQVVTRLLLAGVRKLQPDDAAAKAGLQVNDILLQLAGKAVPSDARELAKLIDGIKANEAVDAVVLRKGKKETVKGLTLPEKAEGNVLFRAGAGGPIVIQALPGGPGFPMPGPGLVPLPGGPGAGAMIQLLGNPQNSVITTTVRTTDGFTTRYQEGSLIITLTGSTKDGKAKGNEIHVQDGNAMNKYESLDKVPKLYHDKVKNLVEMSEKSGTQIEIELKK